MRLGNFKFNFSEFQQLRNNYAKYTFCCIFVITTQWFWDDKYLLNIFISQVGSWNLNKFNKYPLKKFPPFFGGLNILQIIWHPTLVIGTGFNDGKIWNCSRSCCMSHMHTKHNQMPKTWEAGINNYFEKEWISCLLFKRNKSSEKRLFHFLELLQVCYLLGLVIKGD